MKSPAQKAAEMSAKVELSETRRYREQELLAAVPFPVLPENKNGIIKIQICSDKGKTRYMNITPDEFKRIESILTTGKDYVK
jgi:hypothetical protein